MALDDNGGEVCVCAGTEEMAGRVVVHLVWSEFAVEHEPVAKMTFPRSMGAEGRAVRAANTISICRSPERV